MIWSKPHIFHFPILDYRCGKMNRIDYRCGKINRIDYRCGKMNTIDYRCGKMNREYCIILRQVSGKPFRRVIILYYVSVAFCKSKCEHNNFIVPLLTLRKLLILH